MATVSVFLLHNSFQLLLFVAHAAGTGVDALQLDYRSGHLRGKASIPMRPFSGTSVVSNTTINLTPLLLHGSPSPTSAGMADQKSSRAHCPSHTGVPLPGLSLACLLLTLSPFKSGLKLFQSALLTPAQGPFSPFETGVPCLLPAGLVSCKPIHYQRTQNPISDTRLRGRC